MKPRTKLQHRVTELSECLPDITIDQEKWVHRVCFSHEAYANKSSAFCLDCGETFSLDLIKLKRATCPSCNTKLKVKFTQKRTKDQVNYFAIAEIVEEFQVIRNFEVFAYHKKGETARYMLHEIIQYWVQDDGKMTMIGRNHNTQGYCDSWGGDWSIRKEGGYYNRKKYEVYPRFYHPDSRFKKEYSKYGINYRMRGLTFMEAIKVLPYNSHAETLLKAKQFSLFSKGDSYQITKHWPSIKICLRNKYTVKDAGIWMDYLDLLRFFNKDIRNAKFVCPKNLKREHDRYVEKKRIIQRRQEAEKKRQNIEKAQKEFEKKIRDFIGLQFSDGNITVKVLETVQEFMEESDTLKHCLFTNEYYAREDSLILSARINSKPIETIEVSLSKLKVLQSRGLQNNPTDHHDQIVSLVESNIDKIARIARPKRKKQKRQLATAV